MTRLDEELELRHPEATEPLKALFARGPVADVIDPSKVERPKYDLRARYRDWRAGNGYQPMFL